MKFSTITTKLVMTSILCAGFFGTAHAAGPLKMKLQANKIIKSAEGKAIYVAASNAEKGEVVQYCAQYTNTIGQSINDVAVTLPIPANMKFTGEAVPSSAQATTDGKNYASMPLLRMVNGKVVEVPLSEYKALRWNIKHLPAKKSATVTLNTIVY